ncbi:arsenate reductase (glutaredoxin) [Flavobacterium weaverense]|uniref:Arsenate reductase n=1 Tax=Flavobacterium weaverense TaxID=271156 RepID=A0A3L9ZUV0_9FLAO|nr:arsenate reductase (glutaredoxin) [Flavobacterium weaverense]RMA76147.1 arsenate reductase [Flavobacterium weaverense]
MIQIYHNARCGKSRNCVALIEESNKQYEIVNYLATPPSFETLTEIIKKLNFKPLQLVRQKEKIWVENFKDKVMNDDEIIQAMIDNPILIERPIVLYNDKAIIGRDLENLSAFIS